MGEIEDFLGIESVHDIPMPEQLQKELNTLNMLRQEKYRNVVQQYVEQNGYSLGNMMTEDTCPYCNNKGFDTFGATECSRCHRKRLKLLDTSYWNFSDQSVQIPMSYKKKWDSSAIFATISNTRSIICDSKLKASYCEVANQMDSIIQKFEEELSHNPCYIFVTQNKCLDVIQWLYNLMQLYAIQKFSVTNIIPITQVYMEGEACNVCDSEVMFLTLTQYDRKYSSLKLDSIVSLRQLQGLTTIVLAPSDWESFSLNTNEKLCIEPDFKITVY